MNVRDRVRGILPSSKFDGRRAALLYILSMDSGQDETTGNVEHSYGWNARFGRHILNEDAQGFVTVDSFDSEIEACRAFCELDTLYDQEDDES